jgi:hypothetical protein
MKFHWPVIFRAILYFNIAALPVLLSEIKPFADDTAVPNSWKITWICGNAFLSGLIALRAYYDGSAERHKNENSDKSTT